MIRLIVDWLFGWGGLGTAATIGAIVVAFVFPELRRLAIEIAIVAAVATGVFTKGESRGYQIGFKAGHDRGYAEAVHAIVTQNQGINDAAAKMRARIDECNRTVGMHWRQSSIACEPETDE